MDNLLNNISETLSIPPDQIITLGIKAFLEREIRLAELDIADLRDKYLVASQEELGNKIKNKDINSHPAWEDLIAWENSEKYITQLKEIIKAEWEYDNKVQAD
ncbi:MAG: hypothetical protein JRF08_07930 [Deltaproteobacteria bacterium]|nr:hypothetical protein [Deltaproteobacteria bacterium]